MLEYSDMFWNRKSKGVLFGKILALFSWFGKSERCRPDLTLEDGDDLNEYGFDGQILSLPGHSRGAIGVLMPVGVSPGSKQVLTGNLTLEST